MKIIMIDGRLGRDAEISNSKQGKKYIRFSVANNVFVNGKEETEWYDVTSFDDFIINVRSKILTKGTYVMISGTPSETIYTRRDGTEEISRRILADRVELLTASKKDLENGDAQATPAPEKTYAPRTAQTATAPSPVHPQNDGITGINIPSPSAPVQSPQPVGMNFDYGSGPTDDDDDLPF